MNASPDAASALPTVTVDRVTRRLIGPGGRVVELPPLSIRLLEVLHASAPAFVASDQLEAAVWPDTHLSPDTLKQRVRLVRRALEEAGYDPAVLDSARGHGYALRATIVGPASAPEPVAGSWRWFVAVVAVVVLVGGWWGVRARSAEQVLPPEPVRIGTRATEAPLPGELVALLSRVPRVLVLADRGCGDPQVAHLCLERLGDALRLTHVETGAILMQHDRDDISDARLVAAVVQFAEPGVLRWIGGRTGAGDPAFVAYREAVDLLGACDPARAARMADRVESVLESAGNFTGLRALAMLHRATALQAGGDTTSLRQHAAAIDSLIASHPDLALAHRAAAVVAQALGDDTTATKATEQFLALQPVPGDPTFGAECVVR